MIDVLCRAVEADLRARRFPVRVVYGPEQLARGVPQESVIVIDRDRDSGDQITPVQGATRNPRHTAVRMVGARALIWAKASLAGARVAEHERLCDQYVDALYCSINGYMQTTAHVATFPVTSAGFVKTLPDGSAVPDTWPGVVYMLRWRMPRGVISLDFQGDSLAEAVVGATTGEVRVRRNASDPPEIVELP